MDQSGKLWVWIFLSYKEGKALGSKAAEMGMRVFIVCLSPGVIYRATAPSSCLARGTKEGKGPKNLLQLGHGGPWLRGAAGTPASGAACVVAEVMALLISR